MPPLLPARGGGSWAAAQDDSGRRDPTVDEASSSQRGCSLSLSLSCISSGERGGYEPFRSPVKLLHFCVVKEVRTKNRSPFRSSVGDHFSDLQCSFKAHFEK
jgi:hypothetical protein